MQCISFFVGRESVGYCRRVNCNEGWMLSVPSCGRDPPPLNVGWGQAVKLWCWDSCQVSWGIFSAGVCLLEQFGTPRVHADKAQFHALVQLLKKSTVIMSHGYACPLLPWEDVGSDCAWKADLNHFLSQCSRHSGAGFCSCGSGIAPGYMAELLKR